MSHHRPSSQPLGFWFLLIALVILWTVCTTCVGQGQQFGGLDVGAWRPAAPSDGRMRCYRDGVQVECNPATAGPRPPGQQLGPNTAVVKILVGRSPGGTGCNVALHKHAGKRTAVAITCSHGLRDGVESVSIVLSDGRLIPGRVTVQDRVKDFAVLEFEAPDPIHLYHLGKSNLPPGSKVFWVGYTLASGWDERSGVVLPMAQGLMHARDDRPGAPSVAGAEAYFKAQTGISGAPFLGLDGKLYGVLNEFIYLTETGQDQQVGGVHVEWIREFLVAHGYGWALDGLHEGPLPETGPLPGPAPQSERPPLPGPAPHIERPPLPPAAVAPTEPPSACASTIAKLIDQVKDLQRRLTDPPAPAASLPAEPITPAPTATAPAPPIAAPRPGPEKQGSIPWGMIGLAAASAFGVGVPTWAIMALRGVRLVRQLRQQSADTPAAPLWTPPPAPAAPPKPAVADTEPPAPTPIYLGWQDAPPVRSTRNRYVRVEQTDLEGEAFKEAIASWAEANPRTAGILRRVEELAQNIHHGKQVAARMRPQVDNPQITPDLQGV